MPRRSTLGLGVTGLLILGLLPAGLTPASAETHPRDGDRYVDTTVVDENSTDPKAFKDVAPDAVSEPDGPGGRRIEVYTSLGEMSGGMDWRIVNLFGYLVNSVPKNKHSYHALFNSLYDDADISYSSSTGRWTVQQPKDTFAPTAAFLNQVNKYSADGDPSTKPSDYIHVLGARESMDEAYNANSSLARLVMSGHRNSRPDAVDYTECGGDGGCVKFAGMSDSLMHSKYSLFEQAADSEGDIRDNVVFITSSNLNGSSGSKKTNTTIVIYDDEEAFDAVKEGVWDAQDKVANGTHSPSSAVATTRYKDAIAVSGGVMNGLPTDIGATFYPSPRRTDTISNSAELAQTDVEARFLADRAAATGKTNCRVYLIHSLFNSSRSGVSDALADLLGDGCDVRMVLGLNMISDVVDGYFTMSQNMREVLGRVEFGGVHDKAFVYRDNTTDTVFGGSANLTGTSLEYEELAFRMDDAGVAAAVEGHMEEVYQLAKGRTKWTGPSSVSISPSSSSSQRIQVRQGDTVRLATRVSPNNALVTNTTWAVDQVSPPGSVSVNPTTGVVTGVAPGTARVRTTVESPNASSKTGYAYVQVVSSGTSDADGKFHARLAPTLTMDEYQSPGGTTNISVTWGEGDKDFEGVVKLQYYSSGKWKTYGNWVHTDRNGVGQLPVTFKGSKTWRAYGARVDRVCEDGANCITGGSSSKAKSTGYAINVVRSRSATSTPRLYASNLAKKSSRVPFLISWARDNGVVRLQMRSSGGSWKTHSTYRIDGSQTFISIPIANTKYWRVATSTGPTKVSNTIRIKMS